MSGDTSEREFHKRGKFFMNVSELRREIEFGLENLERIYLNISTFARQEAEERMKTSALAYECLGYYNAIEHLIIRILKHR